MRAGSTGSEEDRWECRPDSDGLCPSLSSFSCSRLKTCICWTFTYVAALPRGQCMYCYTYVLHCTQPLQEYHIFYCLSTLYILLQMRHNVFYFIHKTRIRVSYKMETKYFQRGRQRMSLYE